MKRIFQSKGYLGFVWKTHLASCPISMNFGFHSDEYLCKYENDHTMFLGKTHLQYPRVHSTFPPKHTYSNSYPYSFSKKEIFVIENESFQNMTQKHT